MSEYRSQFNKIVILDDQTDGLVSLGTAIRHSQERKTKVTNNFSGLMQAADSRLLLRLAEMLAAKLPAPRANEIVVGLEKSGIVMCSYLALARKSRFNWSTTDKIGDIDTVFSFSEGHRDKHHYIHGIKPGDTVIVVEDEVTSGNGLIYLAQALKQYGVTVIAIASVLETVNFNARPSIRQATGLELCSLVQIELQA